MGLMGSGPDALLGFRLQSSFMMPGTDIVISGMGGTCCVVKVVLSGYQSCHYPCHSVRPGWQAGLEMGGGGAFFEKAF